MVTEVPTSLCSSILQQGEKMHFFLARNTLYFEPSHVHSDTETLLSRRYREIHNAVTSQPHSGILSHYNKSTKQSQSSYLDLCHQFAARLSGINGLRDAHCLQPPAGAKCQHRFRTAKTESNTRGRSLSEGSLLFGSLTTTVSIYGCATHGGE